MGTGKELTTFNQYLESPSFKADREHLTIIGKPSLEQCVLVGRRIVEIQASPWLLGDLCIYVEFEYGGIKEFAQQIGKSPGTLYDYKSVATAYEISKRIENVTFEHHSIAKKWQARDYWLNKAAEKQWSADKMKAARKKQKGWDRARFNEFEKAAAELFNIGDRLLQQYKESRRPFRDEFEELIEKLLHEVQGLQFEVSITNYRYPLEPLTRKDFELDKESGHD